jgi:hypothetical protein
LEIFGFPSPGFLFFVSDAGSIFRLLPFFNTSSYLVILSSGFFKIYLDI